MGREVILEEGGVRVEVEDTEVVAALREGDGGDTAGQEAGQGGGEGSMYEGSAAVDDGMDVEEHIQGAGREAWRTPGMASPGYSHGISSGISGGSTSPGLGLGSGVGTIGQPKTRIVPTARPPI